VRATEGGDKEKIGCVGEGGMCVGREEVGETVVMPVIGCVPQSHTLSHQRAGGRKAVVGRGEEGGGGWLHRVCERGRSEVGTTPRIRCSVYAQGTGLTVEYARARHAGAPAPADGALRTLPTNRRRAPPTLFEHMLLLWLMLPTLYSLRGANSRSACICTPPLTAPAWLAVHRPPNLLVRVANLPSIVKGFAE
jgi:hypothetical protein